MSVGSNVTIVIPARNEEKTVFAVAREAVAATRHLGGRVLVVCDHCSDATADEAERAGALVFRVDHGAPSKAQAVEAGIRHLGAQNDVLGLFDADPTGLTARHIKDLFEPVLTGQAMQSVGAFDYPFPFGFLVVRVPWSVGERVLAPGVFPVGDPRLRGYALEVVLNERVGELGGTTYSRTMSGCHHRSKLAKAGVYRGLIGNLRMWASITKASRHISTPNYERYCWNVFLVGAEGVHRVSRPLTALGVLLLKVGRVVFRALGPFLERLEGHASAATPARPVDVVGTFPDLTPLLDAKAVASATRVLPDLEAEHGRRDGDARSGRLLGRR